MFANIYLFLPLTLSKGVKRNVVEYYEFRFQREIICSVVCEECLQMSIYIYLLFYQMVSNNMLLRTMNTDFRQNSFVMLCEECFQISIYFHPLFSQMVPHDMLLCMINSDFSQKSFVMLCEECLQISIYFYP